MLVYRKMQVERKVGHECLQLKSSQRQQLTLTLHGLPGIELCFGKVCTSEVGLLCHLDSCAAMNTVNLRVHQWLITTYPHLVSEYIQYDDSLPFQPLQLSCAVTYMERR